MSCRAFLASLLLFGCIGEGSRGIAPSPSAVTTVKVDLFHKPLPEIPLPNDMATRFDPTSATGRRINVSMMAPTLFESQLRELIDQLDGWGIFMPISIPFTGPLDIASIVEAHHRDAVAYDLSNDVLYLINIDPRSDEYGRIHHLDVGNGNYPVVLEDRNQYQKHDPRGDTISMLFEEVDEDLNHNGRLDPGEDTDADGILDRPNYLPLELLEGKAWPDPDDLGGRADALMTFYERQTDTLIARPLKPLQERTTYAVVVTRRLKDEGGRPVGSPYAHINAASQTAALASLSDVLPAGTELDDVAFAFSFTTQSVESSLQAVREGLYGRGAQAHLQEEFPARLASLERAKDPAAFPGMKNPYLLYTEQASELLELILTSLMEKSQGNAVWDALIDAHRYVDYHVMGTFVSPQLFARQDARGEDLPLNLQSWPPDLDRVPARGREERVHFWLLVPRKEVSARGQGKSAPVAVLSHGYKSNRYEALALGAYLAKHGIAVISIDCVSHGIGLNETESMLVRGLGDMHGVLPFVEAALSNRAQDLDADGILDPGGDFWTAYMFHTRDVVRQSALDYLQIIRILRTFDGSRTWEFDVLGTGKPGIAGDFDGDGHVDVGGSAPIHMIGGSLGGIISSIVGGLEPGLSTVSPFAGGGGLGDVALRSMQIGVPEAIILRLMGPLYVGSMDQESGTMKLETIIPDLIDTATLHLATVNNVQTSDTVVVENLDNGKTGCALVSEDGTFRTAVESDVGDSITLSFFRGAAIAGQDCELSAGAEPYLVVDQTEQEVVFQGQTHEAGQPLKALAEGMGLKRATPGLRRTLYLSQLIVDPADPASFIRHVNAEPLHYAEAGQKTGAHLLIVTTLGDMDVPASTGVTLARSAGLVDYLRVDPRYGKPVNQVLIDTYTAEAVDTFRRFTDEAGQGVHLDVDNFSQGQDPWGQSIPRLDPPLRLGLGSTDRLGGRSAAFFPLARPTGTHGFDMPGDMIDQALALCRQQCEESGGEDPCGCGALRPFDLGYFLVGLIGNYLSSEGKDLRARACYGYNNCPEDPPLPEVRDKTSLF